MKRNMQRNNPSNDKSLQDFINYSVTHYDEVGRLLSRSFDHPIKSRKKNE